MFVLSQYLLNSSGMCNPQQITSYSIALGLILYSSIYLYILFYNNEYLSVFNKFIIYIVVVDLLLSAFYYFNTQDKDEPPSLVLNDDTEIDDDDDEDDEDDDDEDDDKEYTSESEEEEAELDEESQRYIDNLIAQARISDQQRMSSVMELEEKEEDTPIDKECEDPEELDLEPTEKSEEVDSFVEQQIEHIIEEVAAKKKPAKRAPKKKPTSSPTPSMEL